MKRFFKWLFSTKGGNFVLMETVFTAILCLNFVQNCWTFGSVLVCFAIIIANIAFNKESWLNLGIKTEVLTKAFEIIFYSSLIYAVLFTGAIILYW